MLDTAPSLVPPSVDPVRLIRRSVRCLFFGAIGFVPFVGLGLAEQALRLRRSILAELGIGWKNPQVHWLWLLAMVAVWSTDRFLGLVADSIVLVALLLLQGWWVSKKFPAQSGIVWNPGYWHVFWGVILAYGGVLNSLAILALFAQRLSQAFST